MMVACLSLGGRDVADRFEEAAGVEPVHPFEGGELDGLEAPPGYRPVRLYAAEPAIPSDFRRRPVSRPADATASAAALSDRILPRGMGLRSARALPCAGHGGGQEGSTVAQRSGDVLDCLVVGGGPAGLTAALYLARFKRRFLVADEGAPRAASIPTSHNIPFFAEGIPGPEILARQRAHAGRYGVRVQPGSVAGLRKPPGGHFEAEVEEPGGGARQVRARRVLLLARPPRECCECT
jgi:hypothetical protein